jgi:hypothetical protein
MDVSQLERPRDVTRPDLCRQGICSGTTGRLGVNEMFEAVKRDAALTRRSGMPSFVTFDTFGAVVGREPIS